MPLDAIAVSAVAAELSEKIVGGRIEKIHQPEKDEIRFIIKAEKKQYTLLISADASNPRIHLTAHQKQNPISAPMFCMLMRKRIQGGKIISVTQPDFERVTDIEIESRNELGDTVYFHLFAEIMGRASNIILVYEGKVVDSVKRVDLSLSSVRNILPGITYTLPPSQGKKNPTLCDKEEIFEALLKEESGILTEKAVVKNFAGTSPLFGREVAFISCKSTDARLEGSNILKVSEALWESFSKIREGKYSPCIIEDAQSEKMIDFAAYNVTNYGSLAKIHTFDSISEAMDTFYLRRDLWERMRHKSGAIRKNVTNALERSKKKLRIQQEKLADSEKAEIYRVYGDIITANLYRISGSEEKVFLENYYDDNKIIEIPMDRAKSPQKNAAMYYTKYRKMKTAGEYALEQSEKCIGEIDYLERVLSSIDIAESENDLKEIREELVAQRYIKTDANGKKTKEKPIASKPLEFIYEGYEILVGRNNRQNDIVTCKIGKSYDMWLHTKDIPGSHVLIKNHGVEIPDKVIEYAASLAAYYSSGRESNMVEVDYTIIKNVKKPSGAMPGKVIYDKYKTAYVAPYKREVLV